MGITQQRVIPSTSCLVLGWVFLARIALFNLTRPIHELHELYYDIGLLLREALDRLCVRLNMYLVCLFICLFILLFIYFYFSVLTVNDIRTNHR